MTERPAVAITGLGSVSAQGYDARSVQCGYAGGGSRLIVGAFGGQPTAIGALSPGAEAALTRFLADYPRYQALDRSVTLAIYAAEQAVKQAGWPPGADLGVAVGSSRGATELFERYHKRYLESGEGRTASLTSPTTTLGNLSSWVAQHVASSGPATELSATCSTSLCALGMGVAWLRSGMSMRFLVGGAEAPLTGFTLAQMRALRIYTRESEVAYPCRACARDGSRNNTMVLGEGACLLALERRPWDSLGSERCLGWVRGVGYAVEPIRTNTGLSPDGLGLRLAMKRALADAGLTQVDAVITHTPGTALGDSAELQALSQVFSDALPVLTSNKWMLGHTLGASGALSVEYALYLLNTQAWVEYPYPVPFTNRARPIDTVMVNSVGFGGNAGSVVLSRRPD